MMTNQPDFSTVDAMMHRAVRDGVFPGAVLLVQDSRMPLYHRAFGMTNLQSKEPVTVDTIFDLASLTKPLATSLAVMLLIQNGDLALEQPIGSILPAIRGTAKEKIEVRHLLLHTSGLPAHRPYFKKLLPLPSANRREQLNDLLAAEPLIHEIGEKTVYSDVGFMFLRWVIETVTGAPLDRFVEEMIYQPLGIFPLYFIRGNADKRKEMFAATQRCPWRESILQGVVSDENAFISDGVDGHAGLFGTARAVGDLLGELTTVYSGEADRGLFRPEWVRRFFQRDETSGRTLGFDTPTPGASSSGTRFSEQTIGHLGYTGTSFWSDLKMKISVVLLTNRVHPDPENNMIQAFRPEIHNAVMEGVLP